MGNAKFLQKNDEFHSVVVGIGLDQTEKLPAVLLCAVPYLGRHHSHNTIL